jgi:hypothetical protein
MFAQTLDADERDGVLATAIESAIVRMALVSLAQICAKSPSMAPFVAPRENKCFANLHRDFSLLDYGVTSAATARQAFSFRDRLGERIATHTVKSLHQSNHYQTSPHTARGAIQGRP